MDSRLSRRSYSNAILRVLYTLAALVVLSMIAIWLNSFVERLVDVRQNTDECLWGLKVEGGDTVMYVMSVELGGAADVAGVSVGDHVLAINGRKLSEGKPPGLRLDFYAQDILNKAPAGEPIPYVVERNGEVLNLEVTLESSSLTTSRGLGLLVTYAIFATLWLLIGLIVGLTRPRGYVQCLFYLTGLTVFFAFAGPTGPLLSLGWGIVWSLGNGLFYPSWVLFCSAFPVRQTIFESRMRRAWLYGLSLAPAFGIITSRIIPGLTVLGRISEVALVCVYTTYFGIGIWMLFRGYKRIPAGSDRRPMRVILAGTVITACVLFYIMLIGNFPQSQNISEFWSIIMLFPVTLFVALPLSFGYAIFRYQLMDVRAVVKTALVYTLTTGTILGIYVVLALTVGKWLGSLMGEGMEKVVQGAILILFLVMFEPIRRWVQAQVDRRFFPQYRDYSKHLSDYGARVTEAIGGEQVAELMSKTLSEHLKLEAICVAIVDDENRLEPVASICGEETRFDEQGTKRLQEMLHLSHDLIVLNTRQEEDLWSVVRNGFAYVIGLYAGGRMIGAILLGRRRDGKAISGSQVSFINGVASQGASGIEAARLYERELARRRYEEELATARRIQQSLLPSTMPLIPGIEISAISYPAMAVGGDYYEVIPLPNERFLVMIADVSGKGLPASLYMAELHGMVRVAGSIRPRPKEMLMLLNDHLSTSLERGSFITATIALFDIQSGTVQVARAGHTPILRIRDAHTDTFAPRGLPLGIRSRELFNTALEELTLEYLPGDRFVLYSDGISEAMNEAREEFGDERLISVLSQCEPGSATSSCTQKVLYSVEDFRGDAEQNDDITMVVVEITEERREEAEEMVLEESS